MLQVLELGNDAMVQRSPRAYSRATKTARRLHIVPLVDIAAINACLSLDSGIYRERNKTDSCRHYDPGVDVPGIQVGNVHSSNNCTLAEFLSYVGYRSCGHDHAQPETSQ